jgi:lysozyme family protein
MTIDPKILLAIDYVLHWEDSTLSGKVTEDKGGKTRYGISQHANPDLTDTNFYSLTEPYALQRAKEIYATRYAAGIQADKIVNDSVRSKILDMRVNLGVAGIKIAQQACGAKEDGGVGVITLQLWNGSSPHALLSRLATLSVAAYNSIPGTEDEHVSWQNRGKCLGKVGNDLLLYRSKPNVEQVSVSQ